MQALKDKVTEQEGELRTLQEENSKLQKLGERAESLKGAIVRKDGTILQLKAQVEKLQLQIDALRGSELQMQAEAEKRIK